MKSCIINVSITLEFDCYTIFSTEKLQPFYMLKCEYYSSAVSCNVQCHHTVTVHAVSLYIVHCHQIIVHDSVHNATIQCIVSSYSDVYVYTQMSLHIYTMYVVILVSQYNVQCYQTVTVYTMSLYNAVSSCSDSVHNVTIQCSVIMQ